MAPLIDLLKSFDPELPLEKAKTIPKSWYTNPDLYDLERRAVFEDAWIYVGREEQVREPGSFLTATIGKEPIIVARDKQNELHAFSNVCRHKAAQVVSETCGTAKFFQCRYHGWTYDLGGTLKGTPEFAEVQDFEKTANALPRFAAATFGPFLFVHLGKDPEPIQKTFQAFGSRMDLGVLQKLRWSRRTEYDLECNWKVFVDNYLDGGYHVNTMHPALGGSLNYAEYRIEVLGKTCLQHSPLKSDASSGSVSSVRKGDTAHYWWLMPNFMINGYENVMDTNVVYPLGVDRCRVVFDYYFAETEGDAAQSFIDESVRVAHQVQLEDQGVCESVQRGLSSRTYDTGRLSVRRETGIHSFHRLLAEHLWRAYRTP